jgi:arylsulfatase A-like enzyme
MSPRFTRREFASSLAAAPLAAAPQPPNVVVILSDDHSAPYAGPYGYPVRTPRLDRFAAEGMRFDRAFTAAPQCVPSRAAIMTGRSPVAVRISRFTSPLPPDILTLPDLLRRNGYHTGICRRWFHLDGAGRPGPVTTAIFEKHGLRTFHKRVDFLDNTNAREKTPEIVASFLDQAPKGRPFFLWANFSDPHHVWDKDAIPDPYDPAKLPLPAHLPDLPGVREDLARYLGEVTRMDSEFGSILDVLERRGVAGNTIVVFMGDNGMAFPHGKGSLYDPGLHVPLLVRWPGVVKGGTATRELISKRRASRLCARCRAAASSSCCAGRRTSRGNTSSERACRTAAPPSPKRPAPIRSTSPVASARTATSSSTTARPGRSTGRSTARATPAGSR